VMKRKIRRIQKISGTKLRADTILAIFGLIQFRIFIAFLLK